MFRGLLPSRSHELCRDFFYGASLEKNWRIGCADCIRQPSLGVRVFPTEYFFDGRILGRCAPGRTANYSIFTGQASHFLTRSIHCKLAYGYDIVKSGASLCLSLINSDCIRAPPLGVRGGRCPPSWVDALGT